jgi:DNA repair protein SbcC/Rad50
MIPLKLEIEGLYSYQDKQLIDFNSLTQAGLFGIFGAVGSGKSTILEAISFCLYGETERLNKSDKRGYNMMNLKSNKALIDFEFLNFENKKYRFTCSWKRENKKFDKVEPFERSAYELIDNEWISTDVSNAIKIVGLSYENFKRTIIIPQGKFKEFLELKGTDRSNMMMEIFHLQKFDLSSKVSVLKSESLKKVEFHKGNLQSYETITTEEIELIQNKITEIEQDLLVKNKHLESIIDEVKSLTQLKELAAEIEKLQKELVVLDEEKVKMEALENEMQLFEKLEKQFNTPLSNFKSTQNELTTIQANKEQQLKNKLAIEENLLKLNQELQLLTQQINEVPISKEKIIDYTNIIEIHGIQSELKTLEKSIVSTKVTLKKMLESEKVKKESIDRLNKEVSILKASKIDTSILIEIGNWYSKTENLNAKQTDLSVKINKIQAELTNNTEILKNLGLNEKTWRTELDNFKIKLEKEKDAAEIKKEKLSISKNLAHFASNLHDGDNCPLCGSLEHPSKMKVEDVNENLDELISHIKNIEKQLQDTTIKNTNALHAEQVKEKLENELVVLDNERRELENKIQEHQNLFVWKEFNKEDQSIYTAKMHEIQENEAKVNANEKEITDLQTELSKITKDIDETKKIASEIELQQAKLEGEQTSLYSKLKVLMWSHFENESLINIQKNKLELESYIHQIEQNFKLKTDQKIELSNNLAGINGSIGQMELQEKNLLENLQKFKAILDDLVLKNNFSSLKEIEIILLKTIDVEQIKKTIENYKINLQSTKNAYSETKIKMGNKTFNVENFELKSKELLEFTELCEKLKIDLETKKISLVKLNEDLIIKNDIILKLNKENNRLTNLNVLEKLFKGNGFVDYVSSIYLQNLANEANKRFHRITKNKLSLIINSSNDFEVQDYLNGGKNRNVKTLSGGQTFQASLCLALALAESVQTLNKNNKNFFFIDEGFGTQDAESVSLVYDTLQSLQRENRIVGFISHLAELQERIPRYINILKDEEKGSRVEVSI